MAANGKGPEPRKRAVAKRAPAKRAKKTDDLVTPEGPTNRQLYEALTESTKGVTELVSVLKETEASNKDSADWRKKAEAAHQRTRLAVLVVAILLVLVVIGGLIFQSRDSDRENRADARDEAIRIDGCRNRNAGTRFTREQFAGAYDGLDPKRESPYINTLRQKLDEAPPDLDCDRDGSLTTADYPPVVLDG